jgi:HEAT repeat protein
MGQPIDARSLVDEGVSNGLSEPRLTAVIEQLKPVFERLSFGEQPDYHDLDLEALRQLEPEAVFVARSMVCSPAADLRIAGYQVMGVLDSASVIPDLRAGLTSGRDWERIEALRALGRMSQPEARSLLSEMTKHPDPQTRRAAARALTGSG